MYVSGVCVWRLGGGENGFMSLEQQDRHVVLLGAVAKGQRSQSVLLFDTLMSPVSGQTYALCPPQLPSSQRYLLSACFPFFFF